MALASTSWRSGAPPRVLTMVVADGEQTNSSFGASGGGFF
jgi:hypothetical protein